MIIVLGEREKVQTFCSGVKERKTEQIHDNFIFKINIPNGDWERGKINKIKT
jgi:hypothetical protein